MFVFFCLAEVLTFATVEAVKYRSDSDQKRRVK